MDLLARNFNTIRNDYSIPLVSDSEIKLKEYSSLRIKDVILFHFSGVQNNADNYYIYNVPISLFNKAIVSEVEQFYIKSLLQLKDFNCLVGEGSPSWRFTTQYYRYFFLLTCFQRIQKNGYLFINNQQATHLTSASNLFLNSPVKIARGNYEFQIVGKHTAKNYLIGMKPAGSDLHKLMWYNLKGNINTFILNSRGDERRFLEKLKNVYNSAQDYSPSNTRNILNYNAETSILELEKAVYCNFVPTENLVKTLSSIKSATELNSKIQITSIITQYLHVFFTELLKDLLSRNKKSLKLIKKFEKQNNEKVISS